MALELTCTACRLRVRGYSEGVGCPRCGATLSVACPHCKRKVLAVCLACPWCEAPIWADREPVEWEEPLAPPPANWMRVATTTFAAVLLALVAGMAFPLLIGQLQDLRPALLLLLVPGVILFFAWAGAFFVELFVRVEAKEPGLRAFLGRSLSRLGMSALILVFVWALCIACLSAL
jgi:hypothetical protein